MIGCCFMNAHSSASSGPGLFRIASGIASLPMSCSSAARSVSSRPSVSSPNCDATAAVISVTPLDVVKQSRGAFGEQLDQHVADRRALGAALVGVHALVGEAQRRVGLPASSGIRATPDEVVTSKPPPRSVRAELALATS